MEYTPAMQQYIDTKKLHPDAILFFRIGDFYETFFEDAKIISKELDLILTSKNKNSENPIPMSGIPHHSAEKYVQKLVENGYKIAMAEQTTTPTPGKIVEREVVSIITPGTHIQENQKNSNYIVAITEKNYQNNEILHISRGDFFVGEYQSKSFENREKLNHFISKLQATEIILDANVQDKENNTLTLKNTSIISIRETPIDPEEFIKNELQIQTTQSFGKALEGGRLHAYALLFSYLSHTQKQKLQNINKLSFHSEENNILLDHATIKNLEIFNSSYENQEKYSLVGILDNTKTTGGSRLLREWLRNPKKNINTLQYRGEQISYYQNCFEKTLKIHKSLHQTTDIQHLISKIIYKKISPSFFIKLRSTLDICFVQSPDIEQEIYRLGFENTKVLEIKEIRKLLHQSLNEEIRDENINYIKDNFDSEIDQLRKIAFESDQLLLNYQQELVVLTGVSNIKIKFIKNQGYFIEITNKDIRDFESKIQIQNGENEKKLQINRRNTLTGGQRYSTPYLEELEKEIASAKEKLVEKELETLEKFKKTIINTRKTMSEFADYLAQLDLFSAHAIFAKQYNYCKPTLHGNSHTSIKDGRHPIIEKHLSKDEPFISNDLNIDKFGKGETQIITGPNMGGKSTFLRQNALIILLTHCGFFVPASEAKIAIVDGIFARIGSGDQIAKNQSTFMTEMIEVANILHNASSKSFIIFDELGRGTATYDGLALTTAILEYVSNNIQCKTLIATHYHELTSLANTKETIKNYSVQVHESTKEVIFMKRIIEGGANKSYGIQVAKLAGIKKEITEKAEEYLKNLEEKNTTKAKTPIQNKPLFTSEQLKSDKEEKIESLLKSFEIDNLTPLQALQILAKIKQEF